MSNYYRSQKSLIFTALLLLAYYAGVSQSRVITGRVTDESNSPLPGVNIVVKGTANGTVSDAQGGFSLNVNSNDVLVFSFIGYKTREVAVGAQSSVTVSLAPDVIALSEVVVTGYGTQSKRDITGAVGTVNTEQLLSVPSTNVAQAMQGRVAGVNISNENAPGGNVMVRIRGFGTINDNSPLYVIDGMPTKGNLNTLNLNDVESIQVLKDASAASIYGSRAGNGVVIITTKQGKGGKPKLTYDAYYGKQTPIKFLDLLNTQEYVNLLWESRINAINNSKLVNGAYPAGTVLTYPNIPMFGGQVQTPVIPNYIFPVGASTADESLYSISPKYLITKANKEGTNWFDEIFDPAPIQNHQIGVSGATEQARYSISMNYFDQQGIMKYTSYKRYSLRANTELSISQKVRIGENFQVAYGEQIGQPNGNQSESNPISFAYRVPPITPVYDIILPARPPCSTTHAVHWPSCGETKTIKTRRSVCLEMPMPRLT
jgi:TonB-dependent starch-binding outer membrane protein SusC